MGDRGERHTEHQALSGVQRGAPAEASHGEGGARLNAAHRDRRDTAVCQENVLRVACRIYELTPETDDGWQNIQYGGLQDPCS